MTRSYYLAALFFMLPGGALAAQEMRLIEENRCDCSLDLSIVTEIRDEGTEGFLGPYSLVSQDSGGRNYVVSTVAPGQITVIDPSGAFLGSIGREGDGPGEYRSPGAPVFGPADSMFIYDDAHRRLSIVDSDYRFQESMPVAGLIDFVITAEGSIITSGLIRSAERIGYPLHRLSRDGETSLSFGIDVPRFGPDQGSANRRKIASAEEGGIWSAHLRTYQVEHWTVTGVKTLHFVRNVDWFVDTSEEQSPPPSSSRPFSLVEGIWEKDGLLFLVIHVADADWRPRPGAEAGKPLDFAVFGDFYDSIVEVIDPVTMEVILSHRDPRYLRKASDGFLFEYLESREGMPQITVLRVGFDGS